MKKLLPYILLIIILFGVFCSREHSGKTEQNRENTITASIGIYMPGLKLPMGKPLKAGRTVADAYQKLHPGISVKFIFEPSRGSQEGEWLKTQLVGGIAPDIIQQNAEIAWPDIDKNWYLPLDEFLKRPNPYIEGNTRWMDSFINQPLMNAKQAPDGKLYCVSVDIVETAVFYNKDLFNKFGLELPKTWREFTALQQTLLDNGIIPITTEEKLASDWGQDIIFDMLYHDIIDKMDVEPSLSSQKEYMQHYLTPKEIVFLFQKGFFTRKDPRWVEMYRLLKQWRGYWAKELKNTDISRLFISQRVAMIWTGSWFLRRLQFDPTIDFKWGVFYLPKITRQTSKYATGVKASVIGGAAIQFHITNSAKIYHHVDQVVDFLMYLTAPQNFEQLLNEAMMFIPNIYGIAMPKELLPFNDIFKRRYCAVKWLESLDPLYKGYWRRMMDFWLNDGMTLEEFLTCLEENFQRFSKDKINTYHWDFTEYEKRWKQNGLSAEQIFSPLPSAGSDNRFVNDF